MDEIYKLIEEMSERLGFQLVELNINDKYKKITIAIYKPLGITIKDCETLNKELLDDLDFIDRFKGEYDLEISSPGADRTLKSIKEYKIFKGKEIKITAGIDDSKVEIYTGILKGVDKKNNILVENEYDLYKIPYTTIKKGNLIFEDI